MRRWGISEVRLPPGSKIYFRDPTALERYTWQIVTIAGALLRQGRSMIYAARFDTMNELLGYLAENCCKGAPDICAPPVCKPVRTKRHEVLTQ
jgi:hypothetical protein